MATDKERKNKLVKMADEVIRNSSICKNGVIESESFNGQIAAFSVAVALSGLKPAMAIYFSETGNSSIDKSVIVDLLADMYSKDKETSINKKSFFEKVINAEGKEEQLLRNLIIEYAIALKLAIRTFKFEKS